MCCIGKYGVQPIIEYYTGESTKIITKGFAGVSIENVGSQDAYLQGSKVALEVGDKECLGLDVLPLTEDTQLSWPDDINPLDGKLKVIKYKIIELCPAPEQK